MNESDKKILISLVRQYGITDILAELSEVFGEIPNYEIYAHHLMMTKKAIQLSESNPSVELVIMIK